MFAVNYLNILPPTGTRALNGLLSSLACTIVLVLIKSVLLYFLMFQQALVDSVRRSTIMTMRIKYFRALGQRQFS